MTFFNTYSLIDFIYKSVSFVTIYHFILSSFSVITAAKKSDQLFDFFRHFTEKFTFFSSLVNSFRSKISQYTNTKREHEN